MSFPNDKGNYTTKRKPRPAPRSLTARERFGRLQQAFMLMRRHYRFMRAK